MNARIPLFLNILAVLLLLAFPSLTYALPLHVPAAHLSPRLIGGFTVGPLTPVGIITRTVAQDGSGQYTKIQDAINASNDGDTVLVADGTYSGPGNRDIDFNGKNITVTSKNGSTKTIIDCGGTTSTDGSGNHRGFYIHSGEMSAAIIGFTVKNGYEDYGGGICIDDSNATVQNCTVTANMTGSTGGGISCSNSKNGGLIKLSNCTISNNTGVGGGGVCNRSLGGSVIMLFACTIVGNTTLYGDAPGGGVRNETYVDQSNLGGTIKVTNCVISDNKANFSSGANGGGGVYNGNSGGTISLINCTITRNYASDGNGVFNDAFDGSGLTECVNDVIYGNGFEDVLNYGGSITYCDVDAYYDGIGTSVVHGSPGTGNIDKDPLFVNASAGDLHLQPGSSCLGVGTHIGAPTTDLDGNQRPNPPSMGAYELGSGETVEDPSKLHLLADSVIGDAAGIVCDNLSGMSDALKDKLTLSLPDFPTAINLTGSVTATGPNTNDTGNVETISGKTYYIPPDEYNENQVPQDVTKDITQNATRTVTLTLHFTAGGTQHVITKQITLARVPVVLVHGINADPSAWNPFIGAVTGESGLGIATPFTTVNHSNPKTFGDGLDNGNGPVEIAAQLLSERIDTTLKSVRAGNLITDADENFSSASSSNEVHQYSGYMGVRLAEKRVDVVAWSYGGVITRWYTNNKPSDSSSWYSDNRPFVYVRYKDGKGTQYDNSNLPVAAYNSNIRKVITLGSMWRGVPLASYLNEATFSRDGILTNSIDFYHAPLLAKEIDVVQSHIPVSVPSIQVLATNSKWLSQLDFQTPSPIGSPSPVPFDGNIAYGSVAGDNGFLTIAGPFGVMIPIGNLNEDIDQVQDPSWFPYLRLEYSINQPHNYSDGLVPIWSAAIPGSYKIAPTNHGGYLNDPDTIAYVMQWLNNANLPVGSTLNGIWQNADTAQIQSFDHSKTWTLKPSEMAPHAENDLYRQINGIARINPVALKEINTSAVPVLGSNSATITWQTATDMDSDVKLYTSSSYLASLIKEINPLTPMKFHSVPITGLQPNTTYFYEVASTLFNPPYDGNGNSRDITVGTNLYNLPHLLSFHTPHVQQPNLSVAVLGPNSPSRFSFSLAVTNTGGDANSFTIQGVSFTKIGYNAVSPLPFAAFVLNNTTQQLNIHYTVGAPTAHLLCKVAYKYADGEGVSHIGNTQWLIIY